MRKLWTRRWLRRLVIGAASALVLFTIVGFLVAPPIARYVAQKQLGELLGRKVMIGRLRINPFALSLTVGDFRVYEPDQSTPFLAFSRLYVNAELSSVFRRAPVVKEIALESLHLHVVRTKATAEAWADVGAAYNFSDIVARLQAQPKAPEPPPPPDAAPPRFSLNNIHISDLAVIFDDLPTGGHHELTDLAIGVPFVSTLPVYVDAFVEPGFNVRIDGTPFAIKGRTKPFKDSLETVLELRLKALDLTRYVPFVPMRLPFSVDSARLSLALDVAFVRPQTDTPRLTVKGEIALAKLDVKERRQTGPTPLAALEKIEVRIGESDVTAQKFHVEEVLVSGLDVHVRRLRDETLNLEHMAPGADEPSPHQAPARPAPPAPARKSADGGARFSLDAFKLEKAAIHFRDDSVEPAFATDVRDIEISARGVSNAPGATAKVAIGFQAGPGGTFRQDGTLRLTPLAASGKLSLEGIQPARFAPYYSKLVAFNVGGGTLRLGTHYELEQDGNRTELRLADAFVGLADLALRRPAARDDFFRLAALDVRGGKIDLGAHTVSVAEIVTRGGRVRASRDAKGVVDLTTLTPPPPTSAPAAPPPPQAPPAAQASPAWTVAVARFDLEKWGARFEDRAVSPTAIVTVDPIALHVTDLSTAPGAKLGLDVRLGLNKKGRVQIAGSSTLPPVTANVRFDLRALELVPLQPYFQDQVSLTVTDGTVSVKGQATLKMPAGAAPQMNIKADIDVADLATADRDRKEPLLGWRAFHVGGLNVSSPPTALAIADVSLTDLRSRLVLSPDGQLNLQAAFAPPGAKPSTPSGKAKRKTGDKARDKAGAAGTATANAPAATPTPAPSASEAPLTMTIGKVSLQGGQITFTDQSIRPAFTAEVSDLTARVSGLSSAGGSTADVDVRAAINRSGSLAITGKMNPLAKDIALDMRVDVKDIELTPASPYTAKYAGYGISKGKLDLALGYKIAARRLEATNKVVLDQFTFGDKVDSPDAVKLPVRLAVSLLKDRHGVIDVDLPIAGSLDDPEFKIWRAILKVLGTLVVKAVTAPFSLIASAFGGGEELSHIEFAAGAATLDAVAQQRLATLAKALRERPGISFEIEGSVDPQRDRDGLRRLLYERKLKGRKLAALVEAGTAAPALDTIQIDAAERASLIEATYKAEKFPKPKNALGFEKGLPPAEMEKLLLANTRVENDELRALALARATIVQSTLAKAVPGGAGRLYLVAPRLGGSGRVEFKLKKD